jgi:hypothetical protein
VTAVFLNEINEVTGFNTYGVMSKRLWGTKRARLVKIVIILSNFLTSLS